jgi:RNA polymerase sigma-70 factor (ECF subfamily)
MLAITKIMPGEQPVGGGRQASPAVATNDPYATDRALIKAIAQQDRRAMALLYARHSAQVFRFVLRMTGDASLAEDVVSDVFLEVWRRAGGFQARSRLSTWLIAIARNKMLSARRRRHDVSLDEQRASAIVDGADGPDVCLVKKDGSQAIRRCLLQLPAAQREVIDLIYYREKSIEEVAHIVGAPASTVKTRMFYARRRMEKLLKAGGVGLH